MPDLDESLSQARRELRAEAARLADTETALAEVRGGHMTYNRPPSHRGRFLALAAASIMVIAGLVAVSLVTSDDADPTAPNPSLGPPQTVAPTVPQTAPQTFPATTASPVTVPGTVPPATPATPTTVEPAPSTTAPPPVQVGAIVSSFFLDADRGWLTARVDDTTFQTYRTGDGGGSWSIVDSLTPNITGVRFADANNGWAYDDNSLWATHDGGRTWNVFPDLGGDLAGPTALAVSGEQLYIAVARTDGVGLDVTPVASDQLTRTDVLLPFGAGPVLDVSLAAQAGTVWMVYNDRVVTGSARIVNGVTDTGWAPPAATLGGPVYLYADPTGGPLWALANTGIWAGDMANPRSILYVSDDQGQTFREVAVPAGVGAVSSNFQIATAGPGDLIAVVPAVDGTAIVRSTDGGTTWTPVGVPSGAAASVQFVSPDVGVATVTLGDDGHLELWRTTDGGATWAPIAIGSAG